MMPDADGDAETDRGNGSESAGCARGGISGVPVAAGTPYQTRVAGPARRSTGA